MWRVPATRSDVAVVEMKADFKKQCNHLARNSGDPTQLKTMGERDTHTQSLDALWGWYEMEVLRWPTIQKS